MTTEENNSTLLFYADISIYLNNIIESHKNKSFHLDNDIEVLNEICLDYYECTFNELISEESYLLNHEIFKEVNQIITNYFN